MNNQKVSIIIPAYNSQNFIEKTIESVVNQTYKQIEMIIVDDGSTDDTYNICQNLCNANLNHQVFHKENGGVSSARNYGVKVAEGEFVFFLDSDDILDEHAIELLVKVQAETNSEIVQGGYQVYKKYRQDEIVSLSAKEYFCAPIYEPVVWGKLYKRELLKGIEFNENYVVREDIDFLSRIMFRVKEIVCVKTQIIYSGNYAGSLNKRKYDEKNLVEIEIVENAIKLYQDTAGEQLREQLLKTYYGTLLENYCMLKRYMPHLKKERKDVKKKYRIAFNEFMSIKSVSVKTKIILIMARISPIVYNVIYKIKMK